MLTKILDNKEDKKTIEESFKRIDEYTKDFHVRRSPSCEMNLFICCLQLDIVMTIERNTDEMQESLTVCVPMISSMLYMLTMSASNYASVAGPIPDWQPTMPIWRERQH